jgi:uncharacterized membrane protein YccC
VRQTVAASKEALAAPRVALSATVERRRSRPRSMLIVRTGIAAALAHLVARHLGYAEAPVLAPLTAVLVVQATLTETVVSGLQRLLSVLAGVALAATINGVVGLTPLTMGLLVVAALVVGKLLRLGTNVVEVPITAMVILAVHGQSTQMGLRLGETAVGIAIGIAANLVLLPPVYLEPSVRAVRDLASQTSELLLLMAFGLRDGWSAERSWTWLESARALNAAADEARRVVARGEESARFNPRGRSVARAWGELGEALDGQELVVYALRGVCRTLADRNRSGGAGALHDEARIALADTLDPLSEAVLLVAPWLIDAPRDPAARPELAVVLRRARWYREELRSALVVDAVDRPQMWQANGALLALLDQLLRELETVTHARGLVREDALELG